MIAQALKLITCLEATPPALIALMARLAMAGVFFKSGLTKVMVDGGSLKFSSGVKYLFEQEYQVPFLPWDVAAFLAAANELLLPPLLVIGLATRLGAVGLLGMTAVIQIYVYPLAWDTHLTWATALVFLIAYGPGKISLDHLIRQKITPAHRARA